MLRFFSFIMNKRECAQIKNVFHLDVKILINNTNTIITLLYYV